MANASVTKTEEGVRRFAFECVFIGAFFTTATSAPHEHSVEIQLRMVGVGIWETYWTLVLQARDRCRQRHHQVGQHLVGAGIRFHL